MTAILVTAAVSLTVGIVAGAVGVRHLADAKAAELDVLRQRDAALTFADTRRDLAEAGPMAVVEAAVRILDHQRRAGRSFLPVPARLLDQLERAVSMEEAR